MSVLIDREELIKDLKKDGFHLPERFEYVINNQPTVDAKAVVHGEWIANKVMYRHFGALNYKCNICEKEGAYTNFCPNCGAMMDGKKVNDD